MHKLNETWRAQNNQLNRFGQLTLARARTCVQYRLEITYSDYNRITGIQHTLLIRKVQPSTKLYLATFTHPN